MTRDKRDHVAKMTRDKRDDIAEMTRDKRDDVAAMAAHLRSGHGPGLGQHTRRTPPPGTGGRAS